MRTALRLLLLIVIAAVVIGAVVVAVTLRPRHTHYYTDADTIREPAATARPRDILWDPARRLEAWINTAAEEYEPRLTADDETLFFVRGKAGHDADIHVARQTADGWSEPVPLAAIRSNADELGPEPSPDGNTLYFYSNRAGGHGGYDLWVTHRDDGVWQPPVNLGPGVNSAYNEYGPAITPDGSVLYLSSNRPQPGDADVPPPDAWSATIREDLHRRDYDLYAAAITERGVGHAQPLARLNSAANDGAPAVSRFGDFLYFTSDRQGGHGGFDLYRARRLRGAHTVPQNLGVAVNSAFHELDPGLSLGGYRLHFSSDRPAPGRPDDEVDDALDDADDVLDYDLYASTSREVFVETETGRAAMDWPALLAWLLWILAALLLLWLLWALLMLLRSERFRTLSLIARCLLVSAAAHMLLLVALTFWGVGAALSDWIRPGRGTQVALVAPAVGETIEAQIRGTLTELEVTPVETPVEAPAPVAVESEPLTPDDVAVAALAPVLVRVALLEDLVEDVEARPRPESPVPAAADLPDPSATPVPIPVPIPAAADAVAAAEPGLTPPAPRRAPASAAAGIELNDRLPRDAPTVHLLATDAVPAPPARPATARVTDASPAAVEDHAPRPAPPPLPAPMLEVPAPAATTPVQAAAPDGMDAPRAAASYQSPRPPVEPTVLPPPIAPALDAPPSSAPVAARPPTTDVAHEAPTSTIGSRTAPPPLAAPAPTFELPALPLPAAAARAERVETAGPMPERRTATAAPARITPVRINPAAPAPPETTAAPSAAAVSARRTEPPTDLAARARPAAPIPASSPRLPVPDLAASLVPVALPSPAAPRPELAAAAARRPSPLPPPRAEPVAVELAPAAPPPPEPSLPPSALAPPPRTAAPRPADPAAAPPTPPVSLVADDALPPAPVPPLALPDTPADDAFAQRAPDRRVEALREHGGDRETEAAVARSLAWLARHQRGDGAWSGRDFDEGCGACGPGARVKVDVAVTGLSLLAFLAADHAPGRDGPYRATVERAVAWLLEQQSSSGGLLAGESMYSHGIATIALAEAYGMTRDPDLARPVERAASFIVAARNRDVGGWRYAPGQVGDTSVLGWQVMALVSAERAGLDVPATGYDVARRWLDLVSPRRRPGLFSYKPGEAPTPAMTAEGMFVQQLLGRDRGEADMERAAAYLLRHGPGRDEGRDEGRAEDRMTSYFLYYGTLALFNHQGPAWEEWNEAMKEQLIAEQLTESGAAGSWAPDDRWARTGGQVYQTALCTLTLEVYYRYLPLYLRGDEDE